MDKEILILITLRPEMREALIDYAGEFTAAGEMRYSDITPAMTSDEYSALLRKQLTDSRGEGLTPDRVPQTVFFLVKDRNNLIGSSRLRHTLNAYLDNEGGHIGYDVRPSQRGKGYATLLLSLTLEEARRLGLQGVLVTCDETNTASARVIEKNSGKLLNKVVSDESEGLVRRYWIDL